MSKLNDNGFWYNVLYNAFLVAFAMFIGYVFWRVVYVLCDLKI